MMPRSNGSWEEPASRMMPYGYQSNDCGYCKVPGSSQRTSDSRASYYARSKTLSPEHYQLLLDRGWRRSGKLLYLPDASRSCCRHYAIRLPAAEFKPTRDQRQTLNRWNRFVLGESYLRELNLKFPKSKEEKKRENNSFNLTQAVHESEQSQLKPEIDPEHRFEVTLEPDDFTFEKFALFDNYQRHVHHEKDGDISESGFTNFLCSSPLHRKEAIDGRQLGSFHQCYRVDGRLIAMAVLDLLPHAVSGVYFIYHQDFEKWSFGKLSALRETALALELGYNYYYMGYYIHSCNKMRYKADYKPQFVLDFDSLEWYPLDDEMKTLMDRRNYIGMSNARARKARRQQHSPDPMETDRNHEKTSGRSIENPTETPPDGETEEGASDEELLFPRPSDAMSSGLSLFELKMPGVLSHEKLQREVDLDRMRIYVTRARRIHRMSDLVVWESGSELDNSSLKGILAEFAAAVGPDVARDVVVDFGK